jgi:Protein of unknown function (DUF3124)
LREFCWLGPALKVELPMNTADSRGSLLPLYVGGAVAIAAIFGFLKFRLDRIEELAHQTPATNDPASQEIRYGDSSQALHSRPALPSSAAVENSAVVPSSAAVYSPAAVPNATPAKNSPARQNSLSACAPCPATVGEKLRGPTHDVYVPVDVRTRKGDEHELKLGSTLVVRNTSRTSPLFIQNVEVYGQDGRPLRQIAREPFVVAPFASVEFKSTPEMCGDETADEERCRETSKTSEAANSMLPSHFLITWGTNDEKSVPLIESIMADDLGQIVSSRPGQPLPKLKSVQEKVQPKPMQRVRTMAKFPPQRLAALEPNYELIRYDSNMGLVAKNPRQN